MKSVKDWHVERMIDRVSQALAANYFDVHAFRDQKSLSDVVMQHVTPGMTIGIGGSLTVRSIGLLERLSAMDVQILDHWKQGLTREEINSIRHAQLTCDLFLSGSNAITEKGEIVNIDGFGNRVNAMTFGPRKVVIIAGFNKIVPDLTAALDRIRRIAAPMNAKRLGLPLPCAETGYCHDCKSEARICRVISIIQRKPSGTDMSVYLIHEEHGL